MIKLKNISFKMLRVYLFLLFVLFINGQQRNYSNFYCPSKCVCFRRTIRCMKLELTQVPQISAQTSLLDLRYNNIQEINRRNFEHLNVLQSLLLNNNFLRKLEENVFIGLHQVKHLYLHYNQIEHIEENVFQGLLKMEHLYLHNNKIEYFKPGTFSNLKSLERLFLHNNRIRQISYGAFRNLPRLTRLRLDSNDLICDCKIVWLIDVLKQKGLHSTADCRNPDYMYGKQLVRLDMNELNCGTLESQVFLVLPPNLEVLWGETAKFFCQIRDQIESEVMWMHNDEFILYDGYRYKQEGHDLIITNVEEADEGIYKCTTKSTDKKYKISSASLTVTSPSSPQFLERPNNVTITQDTTEVHLTCKVIGHPRPTITWSKNGISIQPSSRHHIESNGSLTIKEIDRTDFGVYRCEAANKHGRISTSANVQTYAAPMFIVHPANLEVKPGGRAKFECVAEGTPRPKITWFKNNNLLRSSSRINISQDGTVLDITNLKESDAGLYVCEARNSFGYKEVSTRLNVTEINSNKPKLIFKPYNMDAILGTTIEIPCKAVGNPTPGILWKKDGSTLQRTGRWKTSVSGNLYIYGIALEDQGRYECKAINEFGLDVASGYITVKEDPHSSIVGIGDKFVKTAFIEASHEIDKAVNHTIEEMFNPNSTKGYADLFRIIRYPLAPQRELARAAEVFERTLVKIRERVNSGLSTNKTTDFNYRDILSREYLELLSQLSGCMVHQVTRNCSDLCFHSKYRNIDGTCNNLQNPSWGAANTGFRRILKPIYENGFSSPVGWNKDKKYFGFTKPSSRLVSTTIISTNVTTPDSEISHMVMQWGQFLDHDLDHATPSISSESWDGIDCKKSCEYAAPCFPIEIPSDDPRVNNRRCIDFVRSSAICGSGMTSVFFESIQPREQINQLTSFIDASQVYGFSEEIAKELRDLDNDIGRLREGRLYPGQKPFLPYDTINKMDCRRNLTENTLNCFLAGDIRVNEQVGLIAMHTLWFREHNRVVYELRRVNPHWDGETLYHETRKIIGAAMQHITFKHWLPLVIGTEGMKILGEYTEYNPNLNPSISNVFASAALRFGHSLINPVLHRLNSSFQPIPQGNLPLHSAFFSPWRVVEEGGIDPLLRGLFSVPAKVKKPDQNLNDELTERLFVAAHAVSLDLAALNIQRGRDHALPGYLEYRKFCNMTEVFDFDDLKNEITDSNVREKLKRLYGHPGNIDAWVGGILEDQMEGARVGPLFRCLLIEQFRRLRDGDRFWYENPSTFKPERLNQIKRYTLSYVLCESSDSIREVTKNVFVLSELQNGFVSCDDIPKVDFSVWYDCCNDCRSPLFNSVNRV